MTMRKNLRLVRIGVIAASCTWFLSGSILMSQECRAKMNQVHQKLSDSFKKFTVQCDFNDE